MRATDPPGSVSFEPVSYEAWRARVVGELGDDAEALLHRQTQEGLIVEPLYAADHLPEDAPLPRLTRGEGAWRLWQEVSATAGPAGRAALTRERERDLSGVCLQCERAGPFDAATLGALLGDLATEPRLELAIEGATEPLAAAALLVASARSAGRDPASLGGCLGIDPLGALARHGTVSGTACEQLAAAARWTTEHAPRLRAGLVSTAPYANAGADAVQELGFAVATGAESLRRLTGAGFSPETAAGQLLVSVTVGRDLYLQIAKLRALRVLWGMLLARHGAPPTALRLHARTSWRTRSRRDPATDLARVTVEAMAAVLGGCDDLTCSPLLDPGLELELGLALGSATQLLLRDEAGLARIADPAGGSWYVEALTAELARAAWTLFAAIEERGGMARELAVGAIAHSVAEAAERRRAALVGGTMPIVGVSLHPPREASELPHRPLPLGDQAGGEAPRAANAAAARAALPDDPSSRELFAAAVETAAAGSTFAELASSLPAGRGPLRAPALPAWRDAELFEEQPARGAA